VADVDPATVYYFKSNAYVQSLLDEINPQYFGKDTHYGAGFYVAQKGETAIAEVTYQGGDPAAGKVSCYEMDMARIKALDLTDPATAKAYKVEEAFAHEHAVEAEVAAKRAEGILSDKELDKLTNTTYECANKSSMRVLEPSSTTTTLVTSTLKRSSRLACQLTPCQFFQARAATSSLNTSSPVSLVSAYYSGCNFRLVLSSFSSTGAGKVR
jgi:hypothetical protein